MENSENDISLFAGDEVVAVVPAGESDEAAIPSKRKQMNYSQIHRLMNWLQLRSDHSFATLFEAVSLAEEALKFKVSPSSIQTCWDALDRPPEKLLKNPESEIESLQRRVLALEQALAALTGISNSLVVQVNGMSRSQS